MPYRLTIYWISPTSGNKSVPIGLVAAVVAEDPRCAMVAQASFWRLGSGASRWSTAALASCPLCAATEVMDPIHRSPFSSFPIRFTVLVLA
jgi:hypothetical protein